MKRIVTLYLLLGILGSVVPPAGAQSAERQEAVVEGLLPAVVIGGQDTPRYSIYERMRRFSVPGVSVAVIRDGRFDWAEGYGVKTAGGTDSVHTSTLFQAASISKPVAAVGAMRLVDEGRIDPDQDVNEILRSWSVPENEFTSGERVTLRRLLSHTAGTTVHGFPGYPNGADIPSATNVLDGLGNTARVVVDSLPGSFWRYSGGGYTIAQVLVSDVAEKRFADYMRESVLLPLGMYESTFEHPLPPGRADDAAAAHDWNGAPIDGAWHAYPEMAAAGLWTTPTDLARFAIAVADAFNGASEDFLTRETAVDMLTTVLGTDYSLGFGVLGDGDSLRFGHSGANAGFRCIFAMHPQTGDGAVVMTNSDSGADLTAEIMRAVSDVYGWSSVKPRTRAIASVDPADLNRFAGEYEVAPGFRFTIRPGEDRLLVEGTRRHPREIYPESENVFFGTEVDMRFRFDENADGEVTGLAILRGNSESIGRKIR